MSPARIAAHRGGGLLWPENSLLAFRNAIALGSELIEFDVHQAADGGVVVVHDATLGRTTDGDGAVAAHTTGDLQRRRLRGPDGRLTDERLPTFDDVLGVATASRTPLLVEVKGPSFGVRYEGLEERILAALARAGLADVATIMAFHPEVLAQVRALAPSQRTTLLIGRGHVERGGVSPEDTLAWAAAAGITDLGMEHTLVDERVVTAARAAGLRLGVWTVNDAEQMRRLANLGVDIITTDRPDLALRTLRRM